MPAAGNNAGIEDALRKEDNGKLSTGHKGLMENHEKNKAELVRELGALRRHVAELERMEELLWESEQKWRSLAANVPYMVTIVDKEGTILFTNNAFLKAFPETSDGKSIYDCFRPTDHEAITKAVERVFATMESSSLRVAGIGRNGTTTWYAIGVGPIELVGRVSGAGIVLVDLTPYQGTSDTKWETEDSLRNKSRAGLKETETSLSATINAIIEPVLLIDGEGTILELNESAGRSLGNNAGEIRNKCIYDLLARDIAKSRKLQIDEVIRTGRPIEFEDVRSGKHIHYTIYPVFDSSGKAVRFALFGRDITEFKQTAWQLAVYRQRLAHIERLALVGTLSNVLAPVLSGCVIWKTL